MFGLFKGKDKFENQVEEAPQVLQDDTLEEVKETIEEAKNDFDNDEPLIAPDELKKHFSRDNDTDNDSDKVEELPKENEEATPELEESYVSENETINIDSLDEPIGDILLDETPEEIQLDEVSISEEEESLIQEAPERISDPEDGVESLIQEQDDLLDDIQLDDVELDNEENDSDLDDNNGSHILSDADLDELDAFDKEENDSQESDDEEALVLREVDPTDPDFKLQEDEVLIIDTKSLNEHNEEQIDDPIDYLLTEEAEEVINPVSEEDIDTKLVESDEFNDIELDEPVPFIVDETVIQEEVIEDVPEEINTRGYAPIIVMNGTPDDIRNGISTYVANHPVYLVDITENGSGYSYIPENVNKQYIELPENDEDYSIVDTFNLIKEESNKTERSFIVFAGSDVVADRIVDTFEETPIGVKLVAEQIKKYVDDADNNNLTVIFVSEKVNDNFAYIMDLIMRK